MKKTFWPFGILLIIVFGILLLIGLVYISLKQTNIEDNAYMQKYRNVEKNIDALIPSSKLFLKDYEVFVEAQTQKAFFEPPYATLSQAMQAPSPVIKPQDKNLLKLHFVAKNKDSKIKIVSYSIFASHYYDNAYKDKMDLIFQGSDRVADFVFEPFAIGRWKLVLEVIFDEGKEHRIYLQRDFLAKD